MVRKMNFQTVPLTDLSLSDTSQPEGAPRPVVLVVDDEAVIADTRAMILEHNSMTALVAYDGKRALEIAKTIPPDMLLSDVVMPGMNGIDLAMTIRQIIPSCSILLFSGQASTADLLETARGAGQEFIILPKPLHPTEWLARIADALGTRMA
jgi:CheY-like chemotaxis protein